MHSYSINPLVDQTSKATNLPQEKVDKILNFLFSHLSKELHQASSVGFRIEDFGKFYLTVPKSRAAYQYALKRYRITKSELILLHNLAKLRHPIQVFHKQRNFIERFGSWHWK